MGAARYVAFLRAVNVGGRTVRMVDLKKIFEATGLDDVSTFIASGNVIFRRSGKSASALEQEIESALQNALGYPVATMLRSIGEIAAVAQYDAFPPEALNGAVLYVGFAKTRPTPAAVKKALALQTAADELRMSGREIYWLARKSIADSSISMAALEKALQTPVTFRNINTVRRLAAKYPA